VSYDLYFWSSGAAADPGRLADRLAAERADELPRDERVLAFRAELLRRWPEFADRIAPWHDDLGERRPWGRTDLAGRFVGLTLRHDSEALSFLPDLAGSYGLDCYDPQAERLVPPRSRDRPESGVIEGWVAEDHVVQLLQRLSATIGYPYDDLDEAALVGALDDTDDESADAWFEYPLEGTPPLVVRLAQSPGSAVVGVRVAGVTDLVLAARVETLLDVL
jgi:hypothetical protein